MSNMEQIKKFISEKLDYAIEDDIKENGIKIPKEKKEEIKKDIEKNIITYYNLFKKDESKNLLYLLIWFLEIILVVFLILFWVYMVGYSLDFIGGLIKNIDLLNLDFIGVSSIIIILIILVSFVFLYKIIEERIKEADLIIGFVPPNVYLSKLNKKNKRSFLIEEYYRNFNKSLFLNKNLRDNFYKGFVEGKKGDIIINKNSIFKLLIIIMIILVLELLATFLLWFLGNKEMLNFWEIQFHDKNDEILMMLIFWQIVILSLLSFYNRMAFFLEFDKEWEKLKNGNNKSKKEKNKTLD